MLIKNVPRRLNYEQEFSEPHASNQAQNRVNQSLFQTCDAKAAEEEEKECTLLQGSEGTVSEYGDQDDNDDYCSESENENENDGPNEEDLHDDNDGDATMREEYNTSARRDPALTADKTPLMPGGFYLGSTPRREDFYLTTQQQIIARQNANPTIYKTGPTKYQDGANKGHWTPKEDKQLTEAVQKYNSKNWKKIAECLQGRTDV